MLPIWPRAFSRRSWRTSWGAVREKRNIMVAGGTSWGKTTLVNALLAQVANLNERVVFLEDTRGLLDALNDLGFSYRSVTRWIAQDKTQATKTLTRLRRQ